MLFNCVALHLRNKIENFQRKQYHVSVDLTQGFIFRAGKVSFHVCSK